MKIYTQLVSHFIEGQANSPLYFDARTLHSYHRWINSGELNQNYNKYLTGNYENKTSSAIQ
jgi:hypothetical protein